ncbi:unnamed protein product, partial [Mesorhabditis belari]|uniref:Uncharacterized protein n=1 Tax=Mesorhabditis belari TaxID=2138241 RepID=A0AAF3EVF4_9BILA
MALNDKSLVSQITESGIQYAVEYLGSVPIESSILEMTTDLRVLVIHECIYMLAKEHQLIEPKFERDLNRVAQKVRLKSTKLLFHKRKP